MIVATADQRLRALSARDLSPVGAWPLEAPLAGRLAVVGGRCFVVDAAGGVLAFGRDGRRLWSIKLDAPAVRAARDPGTDRLAPRPRRDASTAESLGRRTPARATRPRHPAGGGIARRLARRRIVPVARGTVRLLSLEPAQAHKP